MFVISADAASAFPRLHVGMAAIEKIRPKEFRKRIQEEGKSVRDLIVNRWAQIQENLQGYVPFFEEWGYILPLDRQVKTIRAKGLPPVPSLIQALLFCEATHGVLMGVQDMDLIHERVIFGTAVQGTTLEGHSGLLSCKPGEPVLIDSQNVLASYFQGPDRRTAIHSGTRSVAFFAFGAPAMPPGIPRSALDSVLGFFEGASGRILGPLFPGDTSAISL
ncbi:MAG TPA: hypothetical protein VK188_18015 [Holophaga sp.]|nr:hypothetical protein [Holophaga sp.]